MTVDEAADFLRISRWQIYKLMRFNEIPFSFVGQRKRFVTEILIEWLKENAVRPDMQNEEDIC